MRAIGDTRFCPAHSPAPNITPAMSRAEVVENRFGMFLKITPSDCLDGSDGGMFRASSIFGFVSIKNDKDGSRGTIIHGEHGQGLPVAVPYERVLEALEKEPARED